MGKKVALMTQTDCSALVVEVAEQLTREELIEFIMKIDLYVAELEFTQELVEKLSDEISEEVLDGPGAYLVDCDGKRTLAEWDGKRFWCAGVEEPYGLEEITQVVKKVEDYDV